MQETQKKRIIPCLDVRAGRVVKGVNFVNIQDVGDPVQCAIEYERQGADELVMLDITATTENRKTMTDIVREVANSISVPLAIGGGIRTLDDFQRLLDAGASKVGINTAAVKNPELISEAAREFGSRCVVLAIDAKLSGTDSTTGEGKYNVFISGGLDDAGIDMAEWARRGCELGAGEILLTSIGTDGMKGGFDLDMLRAVCAVADVPVIASGGGGSLASFVEVFKETPVDAALAASVFHFGELTVPQVKAYLKERGVFN